MRRSGALHQLRIRKIGPSNRQAHADAPKIPAFDTITVESGVRLVLGDAIRVGCGARLPRIAYSKSWARETANASRRAQDSRIRYHRQTAWPLIGARRTESSGMRRQTASHCAFAKMGPRIGEYASGPSNIGEVSFSTATVYVCSMFVNASSVGCGGRAPCIAH